MAAARLVARSVLARARLGRGQKLALNSSQGPLTSMNKKYLHTSLVQRDEFMEQARIEKEQQEKERMNLDNEEEIKNDLLDAALEEVLSYGWNKSAVVAAVTKLGHPTVVAGLVGVEEVVLHHIRKSNKQLDEWMVEEVARLTAEGGKLPIGKFVRSCVVQRLSMNIPYLETGLWAQGLALLAQPAWAVAGVGLGQEVCDDIWYRAGDTSADYNWYTKRVSLGVVMAATEVFMVQDTSDGFKDTWDFLDRRLEDLAMIPTLTKVPGDVAGMVEGFFQTAKILIKLSV
eukprot:GFUD01033243.1.p1 GENE.GFUD01033243.1~~GFUD01033243.1.p1  ORF type:complete len:287 (+),score=97.52 GFUD01033243.1:51-911(+)